jgi:hypothetical protein
VTVTDTAGHTATWHTDSSGYADVYLKTSGREPGETATATIAGERCSTTL